MTSITAPRAVAVASLVTMLSFTIGCGNVTVMNEHAEVPAPTYAYEAPPPPTDAEIAACETVKTLATVDAALSTAAFILSLASKHHRAPARHLLRAASDVPAATMRCSPGD